MSPIQIHSIPMGLSRAYLVESESGMVLVDAGVRGYHQRVLRRMRALDRDDLQLIFITHAHLDHYGSATALRRFTGAPIAIHQSDGNSMAQGETALGSVRGRGRLVQAFFPMIRPFIHPEPTEADRLLKDGDTLGDCDLDATVLHTPGHTPGSACLMIGGQFAFVGDLCSSHGRPHAQRFFADDWSLIGGSLDRLREQKPEWIFPGHGRKPISRVDLLTLEAPAV